MATSLAQPGEPIHRLTVEQYRRMTDAGILGPDDRVELLEGLLVEKMTKSPLHRIATRRTRVALESVVPEGFYVDTQEPIVTDDSEPEPDVAVIRGKTEDYSAQNPGAACVGLVVEIAQTSVARDRDLKGRIYARARIPVYWLLALDRRTLEVYGVPSGTGAGAAYQTMTEHGERDQVRLVLDGREIARIPVASLLP